MLDATALGFTLGAAVLAALVSGLPPVLALLRDDLTGAIREAGRQGGAGRRAQRMRGALVVVQLAMSVMLLVGAGLLTKSFYGLLGEGPGFNAGSVWTARTTLAGLALRGAATRGRAFSNRRSRRLRALPGVADAGVTSVLPFAATNDQGSIVIDGFVLPPGGCRAARPAPLDRRALLGRRSVSPSSPVATSRRTRPSPSSSSTRISPTSTGRRQRASGNGCSAFPSGPRTLGTRSSVSYRR